MVIEVIGFIVDGRQSNIFCDVQIEQGKIVPTEIVEFKTTIFNNS